MTILGTSVSVIAIFTTLVTNAAKQKYDSGFATASLQHEYELQTTELRDWNVYLELAEDSQESASSSNSDLAYEPRARLTTDLSINLPIAVTSDPTARSTPKAPATPETPAPSFSDSTLEASAAASVLTIRGTRGVIDHVTLASTPTAMAWNSAGADVAAATAAGIEIVSVADSRTYETLAGFPKQVESLTWSANDTRVTATAEDGSTATWRVTTGNVIQGVNSNWFTGITPVRGTGRAVALTRSGTAVVIDENTERIERRIDLPVGVYPAIDAGGSHDAFAVGRSAGSSFLVRIDPVTGVQHIYPLKSCVVDGLAVAGDGRTVALGCASDQFAVLDLGSGQIATFTVSDNDPVVSVAWAGRKAILVGTERGNIFELAAGATQVDRVLKAECIGGGAEHILTILDGSAFVATGTNASSTSCSHRGLLTGNDWHLDHLVFGDEAGYTADSVAATPDGKTFAVGFSDGAIRTDSVIQLDPQAVRIDAEGEIRGLAYSDDGRKLLAVTRDGEIIEYATRADRLTLDQMQTEAGRRVKRAEQSGLFKPPGSH